MRCFCFENELETVRNRQKIARCARRFMRPSKVEMATSHTEVVQLLAVRPQGVRRNALSFVRGLRADCGATLVHLYRVKPWAADVWRRTCEVREEYSRTRSLLTEYM